MNEGDRLQLIVLDAALTEMIEEAEYFEKRSGRELADRWGLAVLGGIESLTDDAVSRQAVPFSSPRLRLMRRIPVPGFDRYSISYQVLDEATLTVVGVLHRSRDVARIRATPRT